MATLKKPKANYKIFDKSQGKYLSPGYRSKSTWTSMFWVMAAAEDYAQRRGGKKFLEENIEIHIFPVESAVKVSWNEMVELSMEEVRKKEERARKREEEQKKRAIEWEKSRFNEVYREKLNELKNLQKRGKQLGLTLEDGTYFIRETEHKKIKDEFGNTDWRDTGEMGG